jgi:hypothetical protein
MSNDAHGTIRLGKYNFPSMLHIFLVEPFTAYMKKGLSPDHIFC